MNILFIPPRFPYPLLQGDRVRSYQQLRLLSSQHSITLLVPEPERNRKECLNILRDYCAQIITYSISWRFRVIRLMTMPFSHLPIQTLYFYDPRIIQKIRNILATQSIDLVHVQTSRLGPIGKEMFLVPKILDYVDSLSLNMKRRSNRERGLKRWMCWIESTRLKNYEKKLVQWYDKCVVSSNVDRNIIGNREDVFLVPNGVDINSFPIIMEGRESATIVFTGRMHYFPNSDAAIWFSKKVFPRVLEHVPEARFIIVGVNPPFRIRQLSKCPNIEVTGRVENIHDYLARATLAVAPMRAGSGTQLKILEAMASGTPVVTTSYAIGGLEVADGIHLLIANDPHEFADKTIRLIQDSPLRRRLAIDARKLIENKYSWEHSVKLLEAIYEQSISGQSS